MYLPLPERRQPKAHIRRCRSFGRAVHSWTNITESLYHMLPHVPLVALVVLSGRGLSRVNYQPAQLTQVYYFTPNIRTDEKSRANHINLIIAPYLLNYH